MAFFQAPPVLGNQFTTDKSLRSYLTRALPEDVRRAVEPELLEMGELAGHRLFELDAKHRGEEPKLVQWDAWGHRIDAIELTPV